MWSQRTQALIEAARDEDLGTVGDITSAILLDAAEAVTARVVMREAGIVCGLALGPEVCRSFAQRFGCDLAFAALECEDGQRVPANTTVATVSGPHAAVLSVERTLLNFLGRMSGVATLTAEYVRTARAAQADVQILDTRKTIPGWRELDKYAVRCGGGTNHRFGLHDAVLIKDNHLAGIATERLADALREMLARTCATPAFVEVEVDDLAQMRAVCEVSDVDFILLDNFSLEDLRAAVTYRDERGLRERVKLEASGGVTLATIADIAATGVDRISVGALTHSATSHDLALDR